MKKRPYHINVIKTSLLYLTFAAAWIILSDYLVLQVTHNYDSTVMQSYKGLIFVFFTTILLYILLFRKERKQFIANQKLIESEDRYRKFVDQLSDIIFRIDLPEAIDKNIQKEKQVELIYHHGYVANHNAAFLKNIAGIDTNTNGKVTLAELSPFVSKELLQKFIASEYYLQNKEITIHRQDNKRQHLIYNLAGFGNHDTDYLVCIWITINDVSRVRASESHLAVAVQGAKLGIWDLYLPSVRINYNHQMAAMLGYELKELGEELDFWEKIIHPEDLPKIKEVMESHLQNKINEYRCEFRVKTKQGRYKWILGIGQIIEYNEKKEPVRVSGIHMDITERKEAERKVDNSNYFISSIVNNLQEGLIVYDLDYNVVLWNKKMEQITGREMKDILNQNPMKQFPHLQKSNYPEYFNQAKSGTICRSSDIFFTNHQGKSIWYNSIFSPYYSAEGDIVGIIEVLRDISERKRHESNLAHHNDELQKTNQELDNFVYRVSHDLRAPITSALGITRLYKLETNLEVLQQYAEMQERSLEKLDKFIRDILDYSRNSRVEVQHVPIDFNQLLQDILINHHRTPEQKQVNVILNIQQDISFKSDLLRLKIILNNLISNALKFQNPYNENQHIKIEVKTKKSFCEIDIKDNGMGIAEEHLDKLFHMFYRANDKKPGSGIGLYIVKDCLKKLKGDIKVESELDKGSRFTITLPNTIE